MFPWFPPTEGAQNRLPLCLIPPRSDAVLKLFVVSFERGTSRRVYHRRPWLPDMCQLGSVPCQILARPGLYHAPVSDHTRKASGPIPGKGATKVYRVRPNHPRRTCQPGPQTASDGPPGEPSLRYAMNGSISSGVRLGILSGCELLRVRGSALLRDHADSGWRRYETQAPTANGSRAYPSRLVFG